MGVSVKEFKPSSKEDVAYRDFDYSYIKMVHEMVDASNAFRNVYVNHLNSSVRRALLFVIGMPNELRELLKTNHPESVDSVVLIEMLDKIYPDYKFSVDEPKQNIYVAPSQFYIEEESEHSMSRIRFSIRNAMKNAFENCDPRGIEIHC